MVLFFFIVGLEIKRELVIGELSSIKKATLPIIAAAGGMIFPAGIYLAFNGTGIGHAGWAIPVATDIAFVVGILILLKNYIPTSLRIFLTALAIADDIGAVIIIAIFYTSSISFPAIMAATLIVSLLILANFTGVKKLRVYIILGFCLWVAFLFSGIHPTIAGIILAFSIPSRTKLNQFVFLEMTKELISKIKKYYGEEGTEKILYNNLNVIKSLAKNYQKALTPLQRFEINLHPWATYIIIPLFALADGGIIFHSNSFVNIYNSVCLGIVFGLFFGKQIGVYTFSYLAIKFKFTEPRSE